MIKEPWLLAALARYPASALSETCLSRQGAEDGGWGGTGSFRKDIDQAAGMVKKIAMDCRFTLDLITLSDTNDASVRWLMVTDAKNSEVLLMGFGRNP